MGDTGSALKLIGGTVITLSETAPRATAVAVEAGSIHTVGSDEEVLAAALGPCDVIDLHGSTVTPGFVDSHVHVFATGIGQLSADVSACTSVGEVCRTVAGQVARAARGDWVYALGCTPWALAEGRFPTLGELDEAAPATPVYVCSGTLHSGAVNSTGLQRLVATGIAPGTSKTPEERGWFLDDNAHFPALKRALGALEDREIVGCLKGVIESTPSRGVTTLHCLEGQLIEDDRDVDLLLRLEPELPVRTVLMYQTMDVQRALDMGLPRIGGCLTVDGACFEHTACFYEPYLDRPDTRGALNCTEEEVRAFVHEAHAAGLQIGMHAIGDRAIDVLVHAYADAAAACPDPRPSSSIVHPGRPAAGLRHRVEHFHTPTESAIALAKRLELSLPMQPIFSYLWDRPEADHYEQSFGRPRAERMEPIGRLTRAGLTVSGGSDSPVTEIDPLLGIHALVNNPRLSRRTSAAEALRIFTLNGAWVAHDESRYGSIRSGRSADLAVLAADPLAQPQEIRDIPVLMTICRGEVTHCATAFA